MRMVVVHVTFQHHRIDFRCAAATVVGGPNKVRFA